MLDFRFTSAHPAALSNIVEMATGLALNYGLPAGSRSILTAFRMEFLYDAGAGKISAECDNESTDITSDGAHQIEANLSDSRGHVFAYGVASWKVG